MPRLAQSQREKILAALVNRIDVYRMERRRAHIDRDITAKALGMSNPTLRRRLSRPGGFTLNELFIIANTLNVSLTTLLCGNPNAEREETP